MGIKPIRFVPAEARVASRKSNAAPWPKDLREYQEERVRLRDACERIAE